MMYFYSEFHFLIVDLKTILKFPSAEATQTGCGANQAVATLFKGKSDVSVFIGGILSGKFKRVYAGLNAVSGEQLAITEICLKNDIVLRPENSSENNLTQETQEAIIREALDPYLDLNHSNIIRVLGYRIDIQLGKIQISTEYFNSEDLGTFVEKGTSFPVGQIREYAIQIMNGLIYLQNSSVVCSRLELSNILLNIDGRIKIRDYFVNESTKALFNMARHESPNPSESLGTDQLACMLLSLYRGSVVRKMQYWMLFDLPALFRDFLATCIRNSNGSCRSDVKCLLDHAFVATHPASTISDLVTMQAMNIGDCWINTQFECLGKSENFQLHLSALPVVKYVRVFSNNEEKYYHCSEAEWGLEKLAMKEKSNKFDRECIVLEQAFEMPDPGGILKVQCRMEAGEVSSSMPQTSESDYKRSEEQKQRGSGSTEASSLEYSGILEIREKRERKFPRNILGFYSCKTKKVVEEKLIYCMLCSNVVNSPVHLPCKDVFCRDCIQVYMKYKKMSELSLICPTCGQNSNSEVPMPNSIFPDIPKDNPFLKLLETVTLEKDLIRCEDSSLSIKGITKLVSWMLF